MRAIKSWVLMCAVAWLSACGGGGGSAGTPVLGGGNGTGGGTAVAADLSLALSAASVANNGSDVVTATVTAVDANRNALAGIPVTVSVDSNAVATISGATTDDKGVVTATVGVGGDKSNRIVTVTAMSGGLSKSAVFRITGAKLTATPSPAVISPGATGNVEFRLVDVNANPMSDLDVVVSGPGGVQTVLKTGVNGEASYDYTAPATSGALDIVAEAGGAKVTASVQVQAGANTIPAAALTVRSASVSANPSVVPVNAESTSNRSEIRALFLADNNATVENIRVRFDLAGDLRSIGGTFASGANLVYSSAAGVVTTAYLPGVKSSPPDGVTIRACWGYVDFAEGSCPNEEAGLPAVRTTLTVISEPLSVSIGTNALIEVGTSGLDYSKRYLVQVVDSSGQAKADVQVSASLDLPQYYKGLWSVLGDKWVQSLAASCDNEDLNRNGVNEQHSNGSIEDANGSFNLTPGRPALEPRKADASVSFVGSSRTDARGQVVMQITYPQSVASWVSFNLIVSASGISGSEGRANYQGVLEVLAEEVADVDTDVPFRLSPYGTQTSPVVFSPNPDPAKPASLLCTNPN